MAWRGNPVSAEYSGLAQQPGEGSYYRNLDTLDTVNCLASNPVFLLNVPVPLSCQAIGVLATLSL